MDPSIILKKKNEITQVFGKWTAHNIHLGHNIYTMGEHATGDDIKLRRIVQIVADVSKKPLDKLRILDLGCLEGLYAVEFALKGADVVAVEGRLANIEKARLAKDTLSLKNLELVQGDVRNLSLKKYGFFDVVLCLGILYHLPTPDIFDLVYNVGSVCSALTVIDTFVSLRSKIRATYSDVEYYGKNFLEHLPWHNPEKRAKKLWASLDNPMSFWLTKASLYRLLTNAGFTSMYVCNSPPEPNKPRNRLTVVAIKGKRIRIDSTPFPNKLSVDNFSDSILLRFLVKKGGKRNIT